MNISMWITIGLIVLIVLTLPDWKYSRIWGGSYTPTGFLVFILAAHLYTVLFVSTAK